MSERKITDFYRARLTCKIGRDVIEGKSAVPAGTLKHEYIQYLMFDAIEDIALGLQKMVEGKEASDGNG